MPACAAPTIAGSRWCCHRQLRPFQEETLRLLGYQDLPRLILDISSHYRFASAEFSDFLGDRMHQMVSRTAMATYRSLSQVAPWLPGAAEEIYVARTDAGDRAMENEAELIELLQRQGVRIIVPGTLPVVEQIAAFRAARLVIGPHGAGLSNLVFCRSGSFVYEVLPRHYPNVAFNRVAQAAGLNYAADMFESAGAGQSTRAAVADRHRSRRCAPGRDQGQDRGDTTCRDGDGVPPPDPDGGAGVQPRIGTDAAGRRT